VVKSVRLHYKELEKADFSNIVAQFKEFEDKIVSGGLTPINLKEFSVERMTKKIEAC